MTKKSLLILLSAESYENDNIDEKMNEWKFIEKEIEPSKYLERLTTVPIISFIAKRILISQVKTACEVTSSFIIAHKQVKDKFINSVKNPHSFGVYEETKESQIKANETLNRISTKYSSLLPGIEVYINYF